MSGWQPIKTAPRDGTEIILFSEDERVVGAGYWCRWVDDPSVGHFEMVGGNHWCLGDVSHWQPLPEPPEAS